MCFNLVVFLQVIYLLLLQPRMDETAVEPSKVLHVRNLPDGVTEKEVVLLGVPFGRVVNVLLLKQKNQAFLEMGDTTTSL